MWALLGIILWWTVSGVCMAFALLGIAINWAALVHNLMAGRRSWKQTSSVLILPGVAGLLGMVACPIAAVRYYAWAPLLLDPTIPMAAWLVLSGRLRHIDDQRRQG